MKTFLLATLFSLLIVFAGCSHSADVTIQLQWTAVGDDDTIGTATQYDLRSSTDSTTLVLWDSQSTVIPTPAPQAAGETEILLYEFTGVIGTTYYFAIKAIDDAGNISPISNIVSYLVPDNIAPGAIQTLMLSIPTN